MDATKIGSARGQFLSRSNFYLFLLCIAIYVAAVLAYVSWSNHKTRNTLYHEIDKRLLVAAKTLKFILPENFHDRAVDQGAISYTEELQNRKVISQFARETDFEYVYTLVRKENRFFFSAPTVTDEEARERKSWYFYPYDDIPEAFRSAYDGHQPVFATYHDQWGTFRSVALPQDSPGGRRYLACADYNVGYVKTLLKENYLTSVAESLLFLLLTLPFILFFRRMYHCYNRQLVDFNNVLCRHKEDLEKTVIARTRELEDSNTRLKMEIENRRRYEDELRRYAYIVSTSKDLMALLSPDLVYLAANKSYCRAHAVKKENLVGKKLTDLISPPFFQATVAEKLARCLKGEAVRFNAWYEFNGIGKRFLDVTYYPFFKKNREVAGIVVNSRDITENKNLQDQLHRATKMEALGALAGGVAHDLNNILSGLVSYPDLLLLDLPVESPMARPLQTIKQSGEKAAAIVQDLLTMARRGVSVTEVVNLNDVLGEYLASPEFQSLKSSSPRVSVETVLAGDLLPIRGSAVHLYKTIMNLVINAAEALPSGGRILIATCNQYIDRPVKGYDRVDEGDYVVLSVSDTGIGIRPEDAERIFEPFYTRKAMGRSGSGLGMSVVWGVVKDHHGYIDISSQQNAGATFKLYFPVTREVLGDVGGGALGPDDIRGDGLTVLVVDDMPEQRAIARGMLEKLGYTVFCAAGGEEAVAFLQKRPVDVLLLDMIMTPGIDGLETYRRVVDIYPAQKAVIASGFSETRRVKDAQALGAGSYLKKPYTIRKLGAALKKELPHPVPEQVVH